MNFYQYSMIALLAATAGTCLAMEMELPEKEEKLDVEAIIANIHERDSLVTNRRNRKLRRTQPQSVIEQILHPEANTDEEANISEVSLLSISDDESSVRTQPQSMIEQILHPEANASEEANISEVSLLSISDDESSDSDSESSEEFERGSLVDWRSSRQRTAEFIRNRARLERIDRAQEEASRLRRAKEANDKKENVRPKRVKRVKPYNPTNEEIAKVAQILRKMR